MTEHFEAQDQLDEIYQLVSRGLLDQAHNSSLALCNSSPDNLDAWLLLAKIQMRLGYKREAMTSCAEAHQRHPHAAEPFLLLADLHRNIGNLLAATHALSHAVSRAPHDAAIRQRLGLALYNQGNYAAAIVAFREALACNAKMPETLHGLGLTLRATGHYDAALQCFNQAALHSPGFTDAYASQAEVLDRLNRNDEAIAIIDGQLATRVGRSNVNVALTFARLAPAADRIEEALDLVKKFLASPSLPDDAKENLHFEAGHLHDKRSNYDEAFVHFQLANEVRSGKFDPALHKAVTEKFIISFSQELFAQTPGSGLESRRPIFIVGMPRTGTTLVENILARHPQVFGGGEFTFIDKVMRVIPNEQIARKSQQEFLNRLDRERLAMMGRCYLNFLDTLDRDATHVINKLPGNFMHLGMIRLLFPKAILIHCIRNSLDTCLSCYFQNFVEGNTFSRNLTHTAVYYNQYRRIMSHWNKVLYDPPFEVHYEELVQSPETVIRSLLAHCGLPWADCCLSPQNSTRIIKTASYLEVRRPIHTSAIGRWQHYIKHLNKLIDALNPDYVPKAFLIR